MQILSLYKKTILKLVCFIAVLFGLTVALQAKDVRVVSGQILVRPKAALADADFTALLKTHGAHQKQIIPGINVRVINVPDDKAARVIEALSHNPNIDFAEWDYIAEGFFAPNDPYYLGGYQWHHSKIQSSQAWDVTQGRSEITIAVLDTGVDFSHPDLNGKVLSGYNYVANNNNPADDQGHGTAVAGTAAASGNNGAGGAGVAFSNTILPVKVLDASGSGSYSAIANGLTYAANKGARIINMSLGGPSNSSTLQSAVDYAWGKNCVIIAAAGNGGNNTPQYPGACNHVVAVSATDSNDALTWFSSYGSYVSVAAPGQDIWTTTLGSGYGAVSGTSFSSPVTAGVAALVASVNPQLSNTQVVDILKTTSDDLGSSGFDVYYGNGRVNANRAVQAAKGTTSVTPPSTTSDSTAPTVQITSPSNGASVSKVVKVQVTAQDNVGVTKVELYVDGKLTGSSTTASTTFNWNSSKAKAGAHTLQAFAYDAAGNRGQSSSVTVYR